MIEFFLQYGFIYVIVITVLLVIFKRFMFSIFDPFIFIILMLSSSLIFTIGSNLFLYNFLSIIFFYFSFVIVGRPVRNFSSCEFFNDVNLLKIFTFILFLVYFISVLFLLSKSNIPLLSRNPSISKVSIYTTGTGWIRRIIFFSGFIQIGLVVLAAISKKKIMPIALFIICVILSVLLGSKSSLISIFLLLYFIYTQQNLWVRSYSIKFRRKINRILILFFVFSFLIFAYIVLKDSQIYGVNGEHNIFLMLGVRLMEFGDSFIYLRNRFVQKYFSSFNFFDFFRYEFNDLLGMFRLTNYSKPLGYEMVSAYWGYESDYVTGPNSIFLAKGYIFFGYFGGILYSFLIGLVYAYIRKKILQAKVNNIFIFVNLVFLLFQLNGLLRESGQFISTIFAFYFFTLPIFVLSYALSKFPSLVSYVKY